KGAVASVHENMNERKILAVRPGCGDCSHRSNHQSTRSRRKTMAKQFEENESRKETGLAAFGANRWLLVAVIALIAVAGIALGYGYRQQILAGHLAAQQSMANATISEIQGQLNAVTAKLNDMTAAQQAAEQAKAQAVAKAASGKKGPSENKRLKELQARIDDQQKELKE